MFNLKINLDQVYNFENEIAKVTLTRVERRDPDLLNNPMSFEELNKKYPSIPFEKLFNHLKIKPDKINVRNIKFIKRYQELWENTDLNILKNYYSWILINSLSSYINEEASKVKFDFYGKILSGTPDMLPRWKRVISNCNSKLGVIIGKLFVETHFPKESKAKALTLVKYIKEELERRLKTNDWMEK